MTHYKKLVNRNLLMTILLTFIGLTFTFSCAKKEPEVIKIGAILPLTGDAAEYGNDQRKAMLLALEQFKSDTSPPNLKLNIIFEDSRGESKDGVSTFRKLLLQRVSVVLTTLSSVSMAIAPIAEKNNVVIITVAAHPDLTREKRFIIRMLPTSDYYAKEMAGYLVKNVGSPSAGVIFANDDFGNGLKESFITEYQDKGGVVVSAESFYKNETDFRASITKVLKKKPRALFIVGYGKELGLVIRQTRELGFKGTIYGTPEISYPDVQTTAANALEGAIFVSMWIDETNPQVKGFKELYISTYDQEPSLDSYLGYDEVKMIANAIKTAKVSGKSIRDELFQIENFPGLTGSLTVQTNGDVRFPLVLKKISNGKEIVIETDN